MNKTILLIIIATVLLSSYAFAGTFNQQIYGQLVSFVNCTNWIKDGDETDIDCGGSCSKCVDGKNCLVNSGCLSNYCNLNKICSTPNCLDGWQNQDEIGVDCGGSCPPCVSCNNRIKDGDEAGVDCGGSCSDPCYEWRVLALPISWSGSHQEFVDDVVNQMNFFINSTDLDNCRERIFVDILDADVHNFRDFSCSLKNCGVGSIKPFVERFGINLNQYDHIIAFTDSSPCPPFEGCSNGEDVAWVSVTYETVAAHEIGHFYGLEDEYCSNQAGSTHPNCNDGNDGWWKDGSYIFPDDINYLGADLGCDPHIGDCCSDCSKGNDPNDPNNDYFACCHGNIVNAQGGRAIMSYANAPGPRAFDDRSKAHLSTFPKLSCPNQIQATQLASVVSDKIIDLDLLIHKNDSILNQRINLVDGSPSIVNSEEGIYSLLIKDVNGIALFNYTFEPFFYYNGPFVKDANYSGINLDEYDLSLRIGYDDEMRQLELRKNSTIIFSELLNFCNQDEVCNGSETYLSCWDDCKSYSQDGLCLNYSGDGCDPDCAKGVDSDCISFNLFFDDDWSLMSIPLELVNSSIAYLFYGFNISIYGYKNSSWFVPEEIDNKLGYWVKSNESNNITLIGTKVKNGLIVNGPGWQLIGYPNLDESLVNESSLNESIVYAYNGTWSMYNIDNRFTKLDKFIPGYGYWVKVE